MSRAENFLAWRKIDLSKGYFSASREIDLSKDYFPTLREIDLSKNYFPASREIDLPKDSDGVQWQDGKHEPHLEGPYSWLDALPSIDSSTSITEWQNFESASQSLASHQDPSHLLRRQGKFRWDSPDAESTR